MTVPVHKVVTRALTQTGDPYVWGAEASPIDPNPSRFDCSEFTSWACNFERVDPEMPDGSWIQARHCESHGLAVPASVGVTTQGALLFRFSSSPYFGGRPRSAHVAFSLGDGRTVEARGTAWGVGVFTALGRGWTHAGLVPGCDYDSAPITPSGTKPTDQGEDDMLLAPRGPAQGHGTPHPFCVLNRDSRKIILWNGARLEGDKQVGDKAVLDVPPSLGDPILGIANSLDPKTHKPDGKGIVLCSFAGPTAGAKWTHL